MIKSRTGLRLFSVCIIFLLFTKSSCFAQWVGPGTTGPGAMYFMNGNVGIGTSAPAYPFEISSPDNSNGAGQIPTRLRIANITSSGPNAPGSFPVIEVLGARGDGNTTYEGRLALGTRCTVGVNTTLLNQTLGAVLFGGQYGTDPTFQSGKILYPASIQGVAEAGFTGSTSMPTGIVFLTGSKGDDVGSGNVSYGTERMRITNAGNVGIGISTPRSSLDIWGGALSITGSDHNGTLVGGSQFGIAFLGCNTLANGIAIHPSGSVGLGTSQPGSYKLAVEGTIGARKVIVTQAAWADYVFYKDYDLPSIQQVKTYISLHHHLPGVPSAKEVREQGLDLAGNQAILLKKIEELTLYTIDQDKKLESQHQEIREQRREIDDLKAMVQKLLAHK